MNTTNRTLRHVLITAVAATGIATASVIACQPAADESTPAERSGQLGAAEAMNITIDIPGDAELDQSQLHSIAQYVEQNADGEVGGAKVKVKKHDEDGTTQMVITLMGQNLGNGDGLAADLKSNFPALANASIAVAEADPEANQPMAHSDAEDPEVAAQEIKDQLEAQGVDGDINVEVSDDEDGNRRVEVKVEKTEE